jgi:hypothetical protein
MPVVLKEKEREFQYRMLDYLNPWEQERFDFTGGRNNHCRRDVLSLEAKKQMPKRRAVPPDGVGVGDNQRTNAVFRFAARGCYCLAVQHKSAYQSLKFFVFAVFHMVTVRIVWKDALLNLPVIGGNGIDRGFADIGKTF